MTGAGGAALGLLNILLQSVSPHMVGGLGARVVRGTVLVGNHTLVRPVSHP